MAGAVLGKYRLEQAGILWVAALRFEPARGDDGGCILKSLVVVY
jgi:hypothetical protein